MQFRLYQEVKLIDFLHYGRVVGFCHFNREFPNNGLVKNQSSPESGVLVLLHKGFYNPSQDIYVSILLCQEEALEEA